MSEGPTKLASILVLFAALSAVAVVVAMPQGRAVIWQALFSAGLVDAEPMTGLE